MNRKTLFSGVTLFAVCCITAFLFFIFADFFRIGILLALFLSVPQDLMLKALYKANIKPAYALSVVICYLAFFALAFIFSMTLFPALLSSVTEAAKSVYSLIKSIISHIETLLVAKNVLICVQNFLQTIPEKLVSFAAGFFGKLTSVIGGVFFSAYILFKKRKLSSLLKNACSHYFGGAPFEFAKKCYCAFSRFLTGQFTVYTISSCVLFLVLKIFGSDYYVLISALYFTFSFIPYFGPVAVLLLCSLLLIPKNGLAVFVISFIVIQIIEGQILYPKIAGKKVGLSPILTLVVSACAFNVFGAAGAVLAPPFCSVIYEAIKSDIRDAN